MSTIGWSTQVWLNGEWRGFFADAATAQTWIDQQPEKAGWVINTRGPREKVAA
jgi:hypothetical protein